MQKCGPTVQWAKQELRSQNWYQNGNIALNEIQNFVIEVAT